MYKKQNITKYFSDESERKLLDRSYNVLISDDFSIERKLTAIEFLARFLNHPAHRERLEILHQRELNLRIKNHLAKALDGTLFNYIEDYFSSIDELDNGLENQFKEDLKLEKKIVSQDIQSNIAFLRYHSQ